jgi:hypothetical protein
MMTWAQQDRDLVVTPSGVLGKLAQAPDEQTSVHLVPEDGII